MKNKTPENMIFFLLALLAGIVGGAICMALNGYKNLGTVADWVSGIGSFGAIIFAYCQMHVQKNKEEKDKILANRPYFSCTKLLYLRSGVDYLWVTIEDVLNNATDDIFEEKSTGQIKFKNGIYAYELKNISRAAAINVVLEIEHYGKRSTKLINTDNCNIGTSVIGNERAIILPHNIIKGTDLSRGCPKRIYLYFMSIDNKAYCQSWIEESNASGTYIKQDDIEEIPIEDVPNEGVCMHIPVETIKSKDENKNT